jgi:hypothetical protein
MASVSFKQFSTFVDLAEEEMLEQQINEIFGMFKDDNKVQALINQRKRLRSDQLAANKELLAQKDKLFKAAKAKMDALKRSTVRPLTPDQLSKIKDKIWADVAAELVAK